MSEKQLKREFRLFTIAEYKNVGLASGIFFELQR